MKLRTIRQYKAWQNKRVLLRLDLNVPIQNGQVKPTDAWRVERVLPTIKFLLEKKAKVIIIAHLGRPEGKVSKKLSLAPVLKYLEKSLDQKITFWNKDLDQYEKASQALVPGELVLLENIRFQQREQKNCRRLAKKLSKLADIYVNDAFGNIHRQDTSMFTITDFLPSYAGFLIEEEVKQLGKILASKKGLMAILGGAKVHSKITLLKNLEQQADKIFLGGMLANYFLAARGNKLGASVLDVVDLKIATELDHVKIQLPIDVVSAKNLSAKKSETSSIEKIPEKNIALDIGTKTVKKYLQELKKAQIIVWNGPLGYFENKTLVQNSRNFAKGLAKLKNKIIVGGGETVAMLSELKLLNKFTFISTGGGAMVTFLEGEKMPSLEVLIDKNK